MPLRQRRASGSSVSEVEARKTPVKASALAPPFRAEGLRIEAAELAVAHSALETGWWKECWNWNLGNAKAGPYEAMYCFRECGEELPANSVDRNDARLTVMKEYERNGTPYLSVLFKPNHPMCRFRAFSSLEDAVADHIAMMKKTFPKSWIALQSG